jgi:hypothetical protein
VFFSTLVVRGQLLVGTDGKGIVVDSRRDEWRQVKRWRQSHTPIQFFYAFQLTCGYLIFYYCEDEQISICSRN